VLSAVHRLSAFGISQSHCHQSASHRIASHRIASHRIRSALFCCAVLNFGLADQPAALSAQRSVGTVRLATAVTGATVALCQAVPTAQLELLFDKLAAEDGTAVRAAPMPSVAQGPGAALPRVGAKCSRRLAPQAQADSLGSQRAWAKPLQRSIEVTQLAHFLT
jgi:hypothetical protein